MHLLLSNRSALPHTLPLTCIPPPPAHPPTSPLPPHTRHLHPLPHTLTSSHSNGVQLNVIPLAFRWYSSSGGSIRITSNFVPREDRSKVFRSHLRYMGCVAPLAICSSCRERRRMHTHTSDHYTCSIHPPTRILDFHPRFFSKLWKKPLEGNAENILQCLCDVTSTRFMLL